jgi:hypothetical protein
MLQLSRAIARFPFHTRDPGAAKPEVSVGGQIQDMDPFPDYGRIAARFEQIAALANLAGNHSFAERLNARAGQIREDLRRSSREIQAGR